MKTKFNYRLSPNSLFCHFQFIFLVFLCYQCSGQEIFFNNFFAVNLFGRFLSSFVVQRKLFGNVCRFFFLIFQGGEHKPIMILCFWFKNSSLISSNFYSGIFDKIQFNHFLFQNKFIVFFSFFFSIETNRVFQKHFFLFHPIIFHQSHSPKNLSFLPHFLS